MSVQLTAIKKLALPVAALLTALAITVIASPKPSQQDIARGEYLANRVAMCMDCHTPMDTKGQPIANKRYAGASLPFEPVTKMPWSQVAPNLTPAGTMSKWTDAQLKQYLMTGKMPDGSFSLPPMPHYRFNQADAEAVTAYMRTLKPVR